MSRNIIKDVIFVLGNMFIWGRDWMFSYYLSPFKSGCDSLSVHYRDVFEGPEGTKIVG